MTIVLPIDPFQLTQEFGVNRAAYIRFGLDGHNGWDIRTIYPDTPMGRRFIKMMQDCTFYKKGDEGNDGYGKYFETIDKTSKGYWKHTFAHCHSIEEFTEKKQGETGGITNNTGNSSGSHCHWTTKRVTKNSDGSYTVQNYNNGYFGAVNPQEYINEVRADEQQNTQPTKPNVSESKAIENWDNLLKWMKEIKLLESGAREDNSLQTVQAAIKKLMDELESNKDRAGKWDDYLLNHLRFTTSLNISVEEVIKKARDEYSNCKVEVNDGIKKFWEEAKKIINATIE